MDRYLPSSNFKFMARSNGGGGFIPLAASPPMYYHPPSPYISLPSPPPPPLLVPPYIQPPPYLIQSYSAPPPSPPPPTTTLSHIPRTIQYISPPLVPPPSDMFTYFRLPSLQSLTPSPPPPSPPSPPVAFIPPPPSSPPPPSTEGFIPPPPPPSEPCPQSSLLGSEHTDNSSAAGTEDANLSMHRESTQIFCKRKESKKYLTDKQQYRHKESVIKMFEIALSASFIGRMEFQNELPDPTNQLKLLPLKNNNVRFSKHKITSLEKLHKPEIYPEPDLGIPLDLLDLSVFSPPNGVKLYLDPEDHELLRDDDSVTPITKGSLERKDRPSAKDIPWLLKSPLSMEKKKQPLVEKQVKQLPYLNDSDNREKKLQEIEATWTWH